MAFIGPKRTWIENGGESSLRAVPRLIIHPVSLEIAQLAGRIEGEQSAMSNIIAFEDLVIGAMALHLGFNVACLNVKHFQRIPGLNVVTL
jgi:predicted nucleic acid-binding protein